MATDALSLLLKGKEKERVEFKEAKNRFDFEELVKYAIAIANERGGKILLGPGLETTSRNVHSCKDLAVALELGDPNSIRGLSSPP